MANTMKGIHPILFWRKCIEQSNHHVAPSPLTRMYLQGCLHSVVFLGTNCSAEVTFKQNCPFTTSLPPVKQSTERSCYIWFDSHLFTGYPERMSNGLMGQVYLHCCIHIIIKVDCLLFKLVSLILSSKNLTHNDLKNVFHIKPSVK